MSRTLLHKANASAGNDPVLHPQAPATLQEAGLSEDLVTQLVLKMMNFGADFTGAQLAERLGLEYSAIEPVLEFLKRGS